jgi:small conductance mechanosensitive channel
MLSAALLAPDTWFADASGLFQLYAIPLLLRVLGAIAIWVIGGMLIGFACRLVSRAMNARSFDQTMGSYVTSALGIVLRVVLIVGILGMFGVESTSFAALLAAAGVAIGMAWSGLLANFAAGVFLVVLRPFKVGDIITAGGVNGQVKEIGLFATTLDTRNNVRIFVGNNKLFSDNIINHSHNPHVRLELRAQLANGVNPFEVSARIRERVVKIPHVLGEPAPEVGVARVQRRRHRALRPPLRQRRRPRAGGRPGRGLSRHRRRHRRPARPGAASGAHPAALSRSATRTNGQAAPQRDLAVLLSARHRDITGAACRCAAGR